MSKKIFFITSNNHKVRELQDVMALRKKGMQIEQINDDIVEIKSSDVKKIVLHKAKQSYEKFKISLFCEDTGIFIEELNGFPGTSAKFVFKKIGLEGILTLMRRAKNRKAYMHTAICYIDKNAKEHVFDGIMKCTIAEEIKGNLGFGYDPILIPESFEKTIGEDSSKLPVISARAKASSWSYGMPIA